MNKVLFSTMAFLILSLLIVVGCTKDDSASNSYGGSTSLSAPTNVSASVNGSSVKITWNSVSGADIYEIYKSTSNSGIYNYLGRSSNTYYYDNNPLSYNYYKVKALNDYSESSFSSYTYCYYSSGGGSSTPSAPTNVSASVSGSSVQITWSSVSNASSYKIYRSSSSYQTYSYIGTSYSTAFSDNSPVTNNYYKVTAVNSYGESDYSSYTYCHYSGGGGSVPSVPTGVSATNYGSTMVPNIYISWNSVSNATSYKVYRCSSANGSFSQIGSETSLTYLYDGNPMSGNNYYKVKAFNSAGGSSYSDYAVYNYNSGAVSPCPPTVSASGSSSSISVSWTSSTNSGCGNPTSYEVYKQNPLTSSYELKTTTYSQNYRDYDVHPGYNRYAVKAINSYGSDIGYGYSSEIPLSKPSSFSAQKSGNDRINFTWSSVSQATGYDIFMSTSAYGTYTTFQGTTENVTSLNVYYPGESGHTYYFKIRAYWRYGYGSFIFSDFTTYKSVTF